MNIIGTGLSGLVGSRVVQLNPQHQFTDLSLDSGYDILKSETIEPIFQSNPAPVVLHFAAFTDTNAAFAQSGDKNGLCYQLNVVGTQNIVNLCQKYGKHLIHISTDFVFDGTKSTPYTEDDTPNPIEWYGQTKYLAEQVALDVTIVRIAYPYRARFDAKLDLVRKLIAKLKNNETLKLFTDQTTTVTFIDDIAVGLGLIIDKHQKGIYHLVASSSQSPYELGLAIAKSFDFDINLIQPSLLSDFVASQPAGSRPWQKSLAISNQKFVSEYGFIPKTLLEGLLELKKQL